MLIRIVNCLFPAYYELKCVDQPDIIRTAHIFTQIIFSVPDMEMYTMYKIYNVYKI